MKKSHLLSHMIPVLAVVAGLLVGCGATSRQPVQAPAFTVTDLNGKKLSLSDFKGKVVLLDFWATWCPPCVKSTPEVEAIVRDYKDKAVVVLSISLDEDEAPVREFIREMHLENRVAMAKGSDIADNYRVNGIPAFFIIDKKGFVTAHYEGYAPSLPGLWRKELDRLLSL